MASLKIEGLEKSYGSFKVLKGINLEVKEGEVYGLLGPNGAGKTTLFRTIIGLLNQDSGEVTLEGIEDSKDLRQELGYLPSDINFYESMDARENLRFFSTLVKQDPDIEELIELVGLKDAADKKVGGYSTGMKKRLGIAQSLIKDPSVIIYDEPTTGLDPEGKKSFRELIQRINQQKNKTIILSSHVTKEIGPLCDRFGVLNDGVIKAAGTRKELGEHAEDGLVVEVKTTDIEALENVLQDFDYEIEKGYAKVSLKDRPRRQLLERILDEDLEIERFEISGQTLEDAYMRLTS
ncbi:ABC transporter ATP-binding protein [Candidatus Nanohalococcus occultus]|uniref:ABC-type multidrug transport system, ATPase component n=1 Tax=Candidatus Nanohalococcus occultus TaxID=2978047 RepID=A0ABY8CDV5_9ARCH|nr:ABC-type multidrug transport system, ATPase component [Candidatus Nanohaloarchaeota archaeon SVXNc]